MGSDETKLRDVRDEMEQALQKARDQRYVFELYVAGASFRCRSAVSNVRNVCEQNLRGRYELDIIDLYQQPGRAASEQVIAAPTLIRTLPLPKRRFVGDMSDFERTLTAINQE